MQRHPGLAGFSFGVARQLFEPLLVSVGGDERDALLAGAARNAVGALEGPVGEVALGNDPSFAAIHGLYWLAVNASLREPLLLAVDDLHWADEGSARWVLYLTERLEGLALGLVLSWRTGEGHVSEDHLGRLEQIAGAGVLAPAPLSASAVRALLAATFSDDPDQRFVEACHGVTGGNPFLVRDELERADAVIDEVLKLSRTRGDVLGFVLGASFRVAVRARRGELAAAEADIRSVLDLVQQRALAFILPSVLYLGADAVIERPELGDVRALASSLKLDPDLAQTASGAFVQDVRGRLALAEDKPDDAAVELGAAATTYEALHLLNPNASCWRSARALAIAGEDRPRALELVKS